MTTPRNAQKAAASRGHWIGTVLRRLISPGHAVVTGDPRRGRRVRSEEGSALVELALSISVLFTFLFGWMQVCMAISTRSLLAEIAREGTRYAMVRGAACLNGSGNSCTVTAAQVNAYLNGIRWPNLGGSVISVNTTFPDGNQNAGSRVQVTVTNVFPFNIPFVSKTSLTMSSTSVMYILQ